MANRASRKRALGLDSARIFCSIIYSILVFLARRLVVVWSGLIFANIPTAVDVGFSLVLSQGHLRPFSFIDWITYKSERENERVRGSTELGVVV